MVEIVTAVITAISGLLVAWITVSQKRDREEREKRQRLTDLRDGLTLDYMDATANATIACSKAIVDHRLNGELKKATKKLAAASKKNNEFLKEQGRKQTV